MGLIYKAKNKENGKIYIGLTENDLETRKSQHKYRAYKDTSHHNVFYSAIRKYGFDNFEWEVIGETDDFASLGQMERDFISSLDAKNPLIGYNRKDGGETGGKWSEEHRNKIGESRGQKPFYVISLEGKVLGEYSSVSLVSERYGIARANINKCLNNTIHQTNGYVIGFKDYLTKDIIYDKIRYSNKQNRNSFIMINRHTGEEIAEFSTKVEAARFINGDATSIGKVVNGKKEYYKDYVFKYKED